MRAGADELDPSLNGVYHRPGRGSSYEEMLRFGIAFSDWRKATNVGGRGHGPGEPSDPGAVGDGRWRRWRTLAPRLLGVAAAALRSRWLRVRVAICWSPDPGAVVPSRVPHVPVQFAIGKPSSADRIAPISLRITPAWAVRSSGARFNITRDARFRESGRVTGRWGRPSSSCSPQPSRVRSSNSSTARSPTSSPTANAWPGVVR